VRSCLLFQNGFQSGARFADRDMYMRFKWGSGVGHPYGQFKSTVFEGHLETETDDARNSNTDLPATLLSKRTTDSEETLDEDPTLSLSD
jgi:hypothetical protein